MRFRETNVFTFPGGRGARLEDVPAPDPDLATPAKIEEALRAGIPQAPFADFTIRESSPGKYIFEDRATGIQYRRDTSHNPLAHGDALIARSFACFTIDAGGRMHLLRRRGQENVTRVVHHGAVYGKRIG